MAYSVLLWPMIVAAICALLWIMSGIVIMIVLNSEKKRKLKHLRKAAKRRKKAMAKMAMGPAMYPPPPPEMMVMQTLPKMRDTPKVVPLEEDIIYDNKRVSSEIRRGSTDIRPDPL
ncbi:uncharacterized protein LOC134250853 [Saccostrea cucullata]|uniref:uncharacterized protein LOC134238125 n=1 Tax=Saccostrea cuccullata TaxID=36930 RepID=UPI002ED08E0F